MIQSNKFEDLNERFTSLGTGMTQMNKFEDLNGRFASLGTGMTHRYKFRDRWCTLLFILCSHYIRGTIICGGLSGVDADVVRPSACCCCAMDRVELLMELTELA